MKRKLDLIEQVTADPEYGKRVEQYIKNHDLPILFAIPRSRFSLLSSQMLSMRFNEHSQSFLQRLRARLFLLDWVFQVHGRTNVQDNILSAFFSFDAES